MSQAPISVNYKERLQAVAEAGITVTICELGISADRSVCSLFLQVKSSTEMKAGVSRTIVKATPTELYPRATAASLIWGTSRGTIWNRQAGISILPEVTVAAGSTAFLMGTYVLASKWAS